MPESTEQETTQPKVENEAEKETFENQDPQADEDAGGKPDGDVEKKEESPYEKQLREIEEKHQKEIEEKQKIIDNKNRAIEAMKKKSKESVDEPEKTPDDLAEDILKRVEQKQIEKVILQRVNAVTKDESERKVILHHYNNSIVKTGDVDKDLKAAVALSDADILWEQRRNRAIEEQQEDFLSNFSSAAPLRGNNQGGGYQNDPILKQAAELVRAVNPDAVKHLKR